MDYPKVLGEMGTQAEPTARRQECRKLGHHKHDNGQSRVLATFVDCEATSFNGYCTEIGFAQVWHGPPSGGGTARTVPFDALTIRSDSRLIRVERWLDDYLKWDPAAEEVTGISRAMVLEQGQPALSVAQWLNEELAGLTLYSDAHRYDSAWIDQVYDVAKLRRRFRVVPIERMGWRKDVGRAAFRAQCDGQFDLLHGEEKPHRAEADAISWARVFIRSWRGDTQSESFAAKLLDLAKV